MGAFLCILKAIHMSLTPQEITRLRSLIEERLSALSDVEASRRDNARPVELDQTRVGRLSRQDALQSQALSVASLERNRVEIKRLRQALEKIESGDFGWCAECGEPIPVARLEIDPAADYCVRCAERLESG